MKLEGYIGLRYLLSKKNQKLLSLITWISIVGVMVGVMALCVVISGFSGFQESFREKILGNNAPLIVFHFDDAIEDYKTVVDKIQSVEGVKAASPFVYSEVLAQSETGRSAGIVVYGILPELHADVTSLDTDMTHGSLSQLSQTDDQGSNLPKMILGKELAEQELFAFPGASVDLVSPSGEITPFGFGPKVKRFEVSGIFHSGMVEYDAKSAYVVLKDAQTFFGMGDGVKGIQVNVDNIDHAKTIASKISETLGSGFYVRHWMEMNRDLFEAFKMEKQLSFIVLAMIILVASFNIIGTLTLLVMTKSKEIAILKAMGASRWSIQKIFMTCGTVIGSVGTGLGLIFGLILCLVFRDYWQFDLNAVYQLDQLPIKIDPFEFLLIALASVGISFFATLYPAYRASTIEPSEGLRYE